MSFTKDDLAALIESLGLQRPVVLGHSMGARIAAALAVHHPQAPDPPLDQVHGHRLGARIEAVFHQFLEGGGRTLDHLASGDLVHEQLGEAPDQAQGTIFSRFIAENSDDDNGNLP